MWAFHWWTIFGSSSCLILVLNWELGVWTLCVVILPKNGSQIEMHYTYSLIPFQVKKDLSQSVKSQVVSQLVSREKRAGFRACNFEPDSWRLHLMRRLTCKNLIGRLTVTIKIFFTWNDLKKCLKWKVVIKRRLKKGRKRKRSLDRGVMRAYWV